MTKDLILAIDNGTQSVRALVFDLQGNLLAKSRVPLQAYFSTQPGWAEQHPQYFWEQPVPGLPGIMGAGDGRQRGHRRCRPDHPTIHHDQPG